PSLGWPPGPHTVHFITSPLIRGVWYGAQINPKPSPRRSLLNLHFCKGYPLRFIGDIHGDLADKLRNLLQSFGVDLVGGVRGLVIVVVSAGEEEQHRHIADIERLMIARSEPVLAKPKLKSPSVTNGVCGPMSRCRVACPVPLLRAG